MYFDIFCKYFMTFSLSLRAENIYKIAWECNNEFTYKIGVCKADSHLFIKI